MNAEYGCTGEARYKYVESGGGGDVLLLLHGLFGALSNFESIMSIFLTGTMWSFRFCRIYDLPIHTGIRGRSGGLCQRSS